MQSHSSSKSNPSAKSHGIGRRTRHRARTLALVIVAVLGLSALSLPPAVAQERDVVAAGFNGPQGLLVDDDGQVWVIEAGMGGDEEIELLNTETGEKQPGTIGNSARVIRIDPATGEQTEIAALPSAMHEGGTNGGARLALHDGSVYASVGEWADPDTPAPEGMGAIMRIADDGTVTTVADTWQYELDNDPYGGGTSHSHPFGMASIDGSLWVADAGGNAVLTVDPASGEIGTAGVMEPLPGVFPRPDYGGEMLTDPVPTALAVGSDGTKYVSLLSGAPFVPGSAKVVTLADDGTIADHAVGLTMLTDLTAAPDGNLYATQFAIFGEQGPEPQSGALVRIAPDGTSEVVAEGLPFVTSVAFNTDGDAFVAINGVGAPGSGEVIRLAGLAAGSGASQELPTTGAGDLVWILTVAAFTLVASGVLVLRSLRVHG